MTYQNNYNFDILNVEINQKLLSEIAYNLSINNIAAAIKLIDIFKANNSIGICFNLLTDNYKTALTQFYNLKNKININAKLYNFNNFFYINIMF